MSSVTVPSSGPSRCPWCGTDPVYVTYHDQIWGVPVFDDTTLFEFLVLESAQAGLSWITILKRRDTYRAAFANYDLDQIAAFSASHVETLMNDPGIIRNRKKIESAINNARCFKAVQQEFGTFSNFIWGLIGGTPIQNHFAELPEIPAQTPLSKQISKELRKRGFQFVGPTVVYAFMQATGMVNDHLVDCFRHREICHPAK